MKLTRNGTYDGSGKYSLIEHDKLGYVERGLKGTENEFFVIKLKDKNAKSALQGYALSARANGDEELYREVMDLANRSGDDSPWCKMPD